MIPLLTALLSGCVEDPGSADVFPDDLEPAPPWAVAESFEIMNASVAPGAYFVGTLVRVEAPLVGPTRSRDLAHARCEVEFQVLANQSLMPSVVGFCPTCEWAYNLRYTFTRDHLLWRIGVPSACSTAFDAWGGTTTIPDQQIAWDPSSQQLYARNGGVWIPVPARILPGSSGRFGWDGTFAFHP